MNFHKQARKGPSPAVEATVHAGELLFVPRGWWHMALNLEVLVRPNIHSITAKCLSEGPMTEPRELMGRCKQHCMLADISCFDSLVLLLFAVGLGGPCWIFCVIACSCITRQCLAEEVRHVHSINGIRSSISTDGVDAGEDILSDTTLSVSKNR